MNENNQDKYCLYATKAPDWLCNQKTCLFNKRGACINKGVYSKDTKEKQDRLLTKK